MTIGDRIKDLRVRSGISQVNFADKIDVSKQTLYKYENNIITNIPSDKIEKIASLLHVSPAYLMGWQNSENPVDTHSSVESEIMKNVHMMNIKGKKKLYDYSQVLVGNPDYVENSTPILNAAHARTDIKQTAEGQAHDDAIMKDSKEWE
ncbi:helix-turn-helix domain-containing protein [Muricomes intestini]|jgi:transcriptional regulator with XRE-family HTH domain|uniref:helix-turn-helix domain-containing protein n=1 Tax=Muricomes intestini TaxID=1796634 RepID=UPI002FE0AF48